MQSGSLLQHNWGKRHTIETLDRISQCNNWLISEFFGHQFRLSTKTGNSKGHRIWVIWLVWSCLQCLPNGWSFPHFLQPFQSPVRHPCIEHWVFLARFMHVWNYLVDAGHDSRCTQKDYSTENRATWYNVTKPWLREISFISIYQKLDERGKMESDQRRTKDRKEGVLSTETRRLTESYESIWARLTEWHTTRIQSPQLNIFFFTKQCHLHEKLK